MNPSELDALLERLGKQGFLLHTFRTDRHGPELLAAVYNWGGIADVLIMFGQDHAVAYRTPTGPGIDVFNPRHVYWMYGRSPVWTLRALLTLPSPDHPAAPARLTEAPAELGIATDNRMPVRMRRRRS